jgi:hypothetical protein
MRTSYRSQSAWQAVILIPIVGGASNIEKLRGVIPLVERVSGDFDPIIVKSLFTKEGPRTSTSCTPLRSCTPGTLVLLQNQHGLWNQFQFRNGNRIGPSRATEVSQIPVQQLAVGGNVRFTCPPVTIWRHTGVRSIAMPGPLKRFVKKMPNTTTK